MKYLKKYGEIRIPIKVGDTILGGRFKNKKIVVKKIGKNKKGDLTINDKPIIKFRLLNESLSDDANYYLQHLSDEGFIIQTGEDFIRIFKPKHGDFYSATNLTEFNFSEIAGDVERFFNNVEGPTITNLVYLIKREKMKAVEVDGRTYGAPFDRKQINVNELSDPHLEFKLSCLTIYVK